MSESPAQNLPDKEYAMYMDPNGPNFVVQFEEDDVYKHIVELLSERQLRFAIAFNAIAFKVHALEELPAKIYRLCTDAFARDTAKIIPQDPDRPNSLSIPPLKRHIRETEELFAAIDRKLNGLRDA